MLEAICVVERSCRTDMVGLCKCGAQGALVFGDEPREFRIERFARSERW
jgi:hypothetical protein